ncbi:hypothetical protein [Aeromonas media]|uniref:hypothetical protein n=1 Tax=Aeromonas media TaxID=651 RepID=UPI002283246B|nr:hypothetical protein [Aeromonas media]MCY9821641.1 hypothetical protein [Aeromonas media]
MKEFMASYSKIGGESVKDTSNNTPIYSAALLLSVSIIITLAPYIGIFGKYGFSDDQQAWANFGGYVGGVLSPIFSAFAFIGVWLTYKSQKEQLRFIQSRATVDELQRLLATTTDAFESFMNQPIGISLDGKNFTINDAIEHAYTLKIIPDLPIPEPMFSYLNNKRHYLFTDLANQHLGKIAWCMTEFQTSGGSEKITEFYRIKLNTAITLLRGLCFIPDDATILTFFPEVSTLK